MTRQSVNNDGIGLPVSADLDTMQRDDELAICKNCGEPVGIFSRNCREWTDALGYKLFRIRIVTEKCNNCGERTIYRHCMNTIKDGKYVNG